MIKKSVKVKKTVIFTDYQCNNNCLFCIDKYKRSIKGKSSDEIKHEIIKAKKRGTKYLEFIGGEVTIRRDSIEIFSFANSIGFKDIALATNGRMLSYKDYVKKLLHAGINHIILSIHGHTKELHDHLTQSKGSFDQLMAGMRNLREMQFDNIGSNTTIVKQNYKVLPKIGKFLLENNIRNSEFIFVDPNYGAAKKNFYNLVPRISDIAPYIHKCLDLGRKKNISHWHIRYVPLCYFLDYLDQVSELDEVKKFKTEHIAPDFENNEVEKSRAIVGRAKLDKCKACVYYDLCEGIWIEYINKYGDLELKPCYEKK